MKRICWQMNLLMRNEKGGVLILVALLIVVLLGMTALVIDVGQLYTARRQMVSAADAAALAGVKGIKKEKDAKDAAELYATVYNLADAELFNQDEDVKITGGLISVRASKKVDYTFAQVLGIGPSTIVRAIASAQLGPGNPLAPFARYGYDHCQCVQCGDPCECDGSCATIDDCVCEICCDCEGFLWSNEWRIKNKDDECAKSGDVILKDSHHFDGDFSSGSTNIVLLGDMGVKDLENTTAGGYEGYLTDIGIGKTVEEKPGHTLGNILPGLETRFEMAGGEGSVCTSYNDVITRADPYTCDMVLIIPIVIPIPHENREWKIVGYASVLLVMDGEINKREVTGILIQYLTYNQLEEILGNKLEGFVIRLVKTPHGIFSSYVDQ